MKINIQREMNTMNLSGNQAASINYHALKDNIRNWGNALGFQQIGIADLDLSLYEQRFLDWIEKQFHGEMGYMTSHGSKRYRPAELIPGSLRVISVRIDYLPAHTDMVSVLKNTSLAYISRYALGRDYHKLIRKKLNALAAKIALEIGHFGFRAFSDSAPVLEKPLAEKAGLGWIGKHTNLINKSAGSWFFLGEIYTDLPLPADAPVKNHCGSCQACLDICPTQAIIAPYELDARRCISYLTIELRGSIPVELRPLIGNRVYGCDDCQIVCPWNRFAKFSEEDDFKPRHQLQSANLITVFQWTEEEFLKKTEGSAIRRIGYACWLRNIAVGMGNAAYNPKIIEALLDKKNNYRSTQENRALVVEHIDWAIEQQQLKSSAIITNSKLQD